jgi:hypothetical protein
MHKIRSDQFDVAKVDFMEPMLTKPSRKNHFGTVSLSYRCMNKQGRVLPGEPRKLETLRREELTQVYRSFWGSLG